MDKRKSWMTWLYKLEKWTKPLQAAIRSRNVNALLSLKESGADFSVKSKNGQSLLHLISLDNGEEDSKDEEIFDLLMSEHCFEVNAVDVNGKSALHLAAGCGNQSVARKLIEHNANVNCKDQHKLTPLHYAVIEDKVKIVELLLSKGANVNTEDHKGVRPIHLINSKNVLEILVRHKVYIDAQDHDGQTALAKAIFKGNKCCVKRLLAYGADFTNDVTVIDMINDYKKYIKTFPALNIVLKHISMLIVTGFSCPRLSLQFDLKIKTEHYEHVQNEVSLIKCSYIDNCHTIYDYLHMNANKRCRLINVYKEKLKNFRGVSHLYIMILACGFQSLYRKRWVRSAKEAWLELTNIFLPEPCIDNILGHLSDLELINMIGN